MNYLLQCVAQSNTIASHRLGNSEKTNSNKIQKQCAENLTKLVLSNQVLAILDLSSTSLNNHGVEVLAKGLPAKSGLQSLNIQDNELTSEVFSAVSTIFDKCNLYELKIGSNRIGNKGLKLLSEVLFAHKVDLKYLELANCSFNQNGLIPLILSLQGLYNFNSLNIDKNSLQDLNEYTEQFK